MITIRTILCPVDFSPAAARQVDLASQLCLKFNARLVLHHNLTALAFYDTKERFVRTRVIGRWLRTHAIDPRLPPAWTLRPGALGFRPPA